MQGVTWHGTVEDHGGGAHRKHESETEEADARPPDPLWTQPHQPPYWRDDGWEWNGAGWRRTGSRSPEWRRTGQVSPQADEDDDDQHFKEVDEEEGEEKRPYDPALAGPI